jgi:hypothetical protein
MPRRPGRVASRPEHLLLEYDVVFAKGRCALEAMATGAAVIVADEAGLAGPVTTENVERLRRLNFGRRAMQAAAVTADGVRTALVAIKARHQALADAAEARQQAELLRQQLEACRRLADST